MKRIYISKLIALLIILSASSWSGFAQTSTFSYTGGVQSYTVPTGITTVGVDMAGASGGNSFSPGSYGYGGAGGRVQCTLTVSGGQVLYLYVGGAGGNGGAGAAGGWNGGGNSSNYNDGGGGGGASDIRLSNSAVTTYSTTSGSAGYRVLVAGGGGGAGSEEAICTGGAGGGTTGGIGWMEGGTSSYLCYEGQGGTQTAGGADGTCESSYTGILGLGGASTGTPSSPYCYYGGGGGGGYYGGGCAYEYGGGGGGSSFPATSSAPVSNLVHTQGFNGGTSSSTPPNGYITIVGPTISVTPTNLNFGPVTVGTVSDPPQYFSISGSNMPATGSVTAVSLNSAAIAAGYLISVDGASWGTTISASAIASYLSWSSAGQIAAGLNVYVEYAPGSLGTGTGAVSVTCLSQTINVTLNGTGVAACSGTISAGIASINGSTAGVIAGASTPLALSLGSTTAAGGLTYQWESSVGGSSYTFIPGAVLPNYNFVGITTTTSYKCLVTCPSVGTAVSSSVTTATFSTCPIVASGCTPNVANSSQSILSNMFVQNTGHPLTITGANFTSISDGNPAESGSAAMYIDRSCTYSVTLAQGTSYTMTYGQNTVGAQFSTQIFIDFNNNGMFEASETVGGGIVPSSSVNTMQNIVIPANAPVGVYRMRVVWAYNSTSTGALYPQYPNISGCTSSSTMQYGDNRDYSVVIVPLQCTGNPIAGIVAATPDSSCMAFSPTIFNVGVANGAGISYAWQVSTTSSSTGFSAASGSTNTAIYSASIPATPGVATVYYYKNLISCYNNLGTLLGSSTSPVMTLKYNPPPSNIIGATGACSGKTVSISSTPGTGVWTSSDTTLAITTGSSGGAALITGEALGTPTITYTLPTGCYATYPMTVNTNPCPIGGNIPFCSNGGTCLSNCITGGTWNIFGGAASIASTTGCVTGVTAGTSTVSYTLPTGCFSTAVLTVNPLPTPGIVSVPLPGLSFYCSGLPSTAAVELGSSQVGVNYQLYLNGTTAVDTALHGTGSGLNWGVQSTPGAYTVIGTNASTGCVKAMISSSSATVTVAPSPIKFDVIGSGSYCANPSGIPVGLDSSQLGINYCVYACSDLIHSLVCDGGTGLPMNFGNQTSGCYTVIGTSSAGCKTTMNGSAIITANPLPAPNNVTLPPTGGGYCAGGAGVDIQLDYSSTGITYTLINSGTGTGVDVESISGTGASLDFGTWPPGTYTVIGENATTLCTNNMTGTAVVYSNPLPNIYNLAVSGPANYCLGGAGVDIQLSGSDAGINYQLYLGSTPVGGPVAGSGLFIDFGNFTTAGTYTAVAVDGGTGCTNNMAGSATVTITPLPTAFSVTGGGNYCAGGTGKPVGLSSSTPGVTYTLTVASGGSSLSTGAAVGTGSAINFGTFTTAGTYTVAALSGAGCGNNMTGAVTIGINPLPSSTPNVTESDGGNYCAGSAGVDIGLDWSNTGTSYQLYYASVPQGSPIAGVSGPIDFGYFTSTGAYTVIGTTTSTGCKNGMTGSATINVNSLPNVHNVLGGGNYCATGSGIPVSLDGSDVGIMYQLRDGGTFVGSPVAGTGSALSFGLQTSPGTYTVIATNATTGCTKNMTGGATILVNPLPNVYTITGGGIYCFEASGVHIGLGGSNTGIKYQLYDGGVASGAPISGTGFAIDFGLRTDTGTYTIMASNASTACIANMTGSTFVATNPLPNVYAVTGGGSYCIGGSGEDVSLSGSDPSINYQLYFGTSMLGSPVPGTGFGLDFGTQTVAGNYTVMAVNATTTCSADMSSGATIVINPLPLVHNTIGGGNYCAGGTGVTVSLDLSNTGVNYQLYNGGTLEGSAIAGTGASVNFGLLTDPGTYTVVGTDASTGCNNNMAGSATIVVNPLPDVHTVTGGGTYCPGGTGDAVGLDLSQSGVAYELIYSGGVVASMPGTGASLNFGLKTATGTYTITATNTSTTCVNSMAGAANISITPPPTAYAVTGGGNYCETGFGLHVGLANTDVGVNYQLMSGGVGVGIPVPGVGAPIDFGLISAAGTYTVFATDPTTTCTNNMTGSVAINVIPVLLPHVTVTSSGVTGGVSCLGNPVTFNAAPVNGGTTPTYQWMVNGINSGVGSTYSYTPANGDVVTAMIHSNYVCAIPDTGSTSLLMDVSPPELPSANVAVNPGNVVCTGSSATFTATTLYGGTTPTYTWRVNSIPVSTGLTYTYMPLNGDIITFQLGSNFPCRLADEVFSDPVAMAVQNGVIPTVAVSSSTGINTVSGESVTFTATATNAGASPMYQWYINGLTVAGANSRVFTTSSLIDMDSVSCDVTGTCGLIGTNSVVMHVSPRSNVSVKQITTSGSSDISLVPNPNKGAFTVKGTLSTTVDQEVTLEVTDMLGQVVYSNKVMAQGGNINEHIQLANTLANGMYILNLNSGTTNTVFHFVIEQ